MDKQKEFLEIPHNNQLDVAIYQGGFGSGKTWCGSLLGILLARKYAGSRGLVGAKEYELVRKTTLVSYLEHLDNLGYIQGRDYTYNKVDKIILLGQKQITMFDQLNIPKSKFVIVRNGIDEDLFIDSETLNKKHKRFRKKIV